MLINRRQGNAFLNDILQTPPVLQQSAKTLMHKSFVGTAKFWYAYPGLSSLVVNIEGLVYLYF